MRNNSFILHKYFNSLKRYSLNELDVIKELNGIYILFEKGEKFADMDRVVRVGTHRGQDRLVKRLVEHFLTPNKDRSIFRKHIGRAILNRDNRQELLRQWNLDLTSRKNRDEWDGKLNKVELERIEKQVGDYIQKNFTFVIVPFETEQERLFWESRMIATLSNAAIVPSENWLGRFAINNKILQSGMWLIQGLGGKELTDEEVDDLINK